MEGWGGGGGHSQCMHCEGIFENRIQEKTFCHVWEINRKETPVKFERLGKCQCNFLLVLIIAMQCIGENSTEIFNESINIKCVI